MESPGHFRKWFNKDKRMVCQAFTSIEKKEMKVEANPDKSGSCGNVIVIAPVYNEESKIGKVVSQIYKEIDTDVLVVDDGSTDNSAEEAREAGAIVVNHKANKGVGAAIRTGIEFGIRNDYEIGVVVSGSGKTEASEIPCLLKPILQDDFDFVQGSRYLREMNIKNMPLHRIVGTRLYSMLFSFAVGIRVSDGSSGFRAFKIETLKDKKINLSQDWLNHYELEPYLFYKILQLGCKVKEVSVSINYPDR